MPKKDRKNKQVFGNEQLYGKLVNGKYILFADPAHSIRINMHMYTAPKTLENKRISSQPKKT